MLRRSKNVLRRLFTFTPFEIRRTLPAITLEPLTLILALYGARGRGVTLLQVGACDGISNDPVHELATQSSTRSILIEPNPIAFERLRRTYEGAPNVTLVQAAIGDQDGEAKFFRVRGAANSESERDQRLQYASFSRAHLIHHGVKGTEIEQITVPSRTLTSVVAELKIDKIDLLQIDAEGFDAHIVRMALKMPVPPACINFEHIHLTKADRQTLFETLRASGYVLGYDDWNVLAVQEMCLKELSELSKDDPQ